MAKALCAKAIFLDHSPRPLTAGEELPPLEYPQLGGRFVWSGGLFNFSV